jgi:hypothetical protein
MRLSAFDGLNVNVWINHHFDKSGERGIQSLADYIIEFLWL